MKLRDLKDALTPEWKYPENKLVWALRLFLGGLLVHALGVNPEFTSRPLLVASAGFGLLTSLGFAFVPTTRPRTLKAAEATILTAFVMHVAGHSFGLYARFEWYDTALHFAVPLATVFMLFALSQATDWIWNWTRVSPLEVGIYLFSMTVALSTCWEIMEFGMDQLAGTREQDNNFDTMIDLVADVLGAAIGAVVVAFTTRYARINGVRSVSEEPKRDKPRRAPRAHEQG